MEGKLALNTKRRRLQSKIDTFIAQSTDFTGQIRAPPESLIDEIWTNEDDPDDQDEPVTAQGRTSQPEDAEVVSPETISLPLPSSFSLSHVREVLRHLALCELRLREGQANDALHHLRIAIAHKSFIYRTRIRNNAPTTGFVRRLRSYGEIYTLQLTIDAAAKVYTTARKAMVKLGADSVLLGKYKPLSATDLVASTAVMDPNSRGQTRLQLSWIWKIHTPTENPDYLNESAHIFPSCAILLTSAPVLRVNWLRAKSRRDRWAEEKHLLNSEILWTVNYFEFHFRLWQLRAENTSPGVACYSLKQAETWRRLSVLALKAFKLAN